MARPARASKSTKPRTATAQAPAPKTALAVAGGPATEKAATEKPAASPPPAPDKPAVALVPDAAPEQPKRRGRPRAAEAKKPPRKVKNKSTRPEILFLVETGEDTAQYETEPVNTVAQLLDLMDENRKVLATRSWREF